MGPLLLILCITATGLAGPVEADVVEAPAASWADRAPRPLVVRWNAGPATVEAWRRGRWRVLAERAASPLHTRALPAGTPIRVVVDGIPAPPATAPGIWTPADVAAWSGDGLRGARAVDLEQVGDVLWAATLGGGLARWDGTSWEHWDRRRGLPGQLAIEVDAVDDGAWVATDGGLARVQGGEVVRVWRAADGLPDDYTQAVHAGPDAVWAGTYRGLARIDGDEIHVVLAPSSCFSLLHGPDERVWVGYRGLRGLPDGEPIEGVDPELRIYDAWPLQRGVWLASDDRGVLWLDEGLAEEAFVPPGRAAFSLAQVPSGLLVAAGDDGVWQHRGGEWIHLPVAVGLPSAVANEVAPGPAGKAWVGTERGVALLDPEGFATALPLAPLAAGIGVRGVAPARRGVAVASEDGLVWLGKRAPKGWASLAAAAVDPVSVLRRGADWWALTVAAAYRLHAGTVERWPLPSPGVAMAPAMEGVALGTSEGVHVWMPGATQLSAAEPAEGLRALHAGVDGALWEVAGEAVIRSVGRTERAWHNLPGPADLATGHGAAWVASEGGLYAIDARGEVTPMSQAWRPGALVAVAVGPHAVWAAGADGRLWGPDPRDPRMIDLDALLPGVEVRALTAVEGGVWVSTHRGLFYVED